MTQVSDERLAEMLSYEQYEQKKYQKNTFLCEQHRLRIDALTELQSLRSQPAGVRIDEIEALAAMRAERDEAWNKGYAARDGVVDACRAQVLRLTEENEALRKERTSLIETKREQIDRLTADRDHNAAEYEKVLNSYADENQCFSDKLEATEARIRYLEAEKTKALALMDHLVDWIVHDCGAEVPFSGEQDETYTTLRKERK